MPIIRSAKEGLLTQGGDQPLWTTNGTLLVRAASCFIESFRVWRWDLQAEALGSWRASAVADVEMWRTRLRAEQ